ncbi:MAG: NAD-dependent epimerase/dehydratase family protein, partial [Burkholderiaceae bacterium]
MEKNARIYVAGHSGLVGSALVRALQDLGYRHLITRPHAELDLSDRHRVRRFFSQERPEFVFMAAAKVGGIVANERFPADFIRINLEIETNVIHETFANHAERLLFLGSTCVYPRDCEQPIREEYLLSGPLESTNSAYAIAKIAGIEMCRSYNAQHG